MKVFNSIIGSGGSLPSFITPQTVNIGTGGTLALESGNLASINAKLPQLGIKTSAGSLSVVKSNAPTSTITTIASGTSSVLLVASNVARRTLIISNNSTAILYINMNSSAASPSNFSIVLPPVSSNMPSSLVISGSEYSGDVQGIWASANGSALITEVT